MSWFKNFFAVVQHSILPQVDFKHSPRVLMFHRLMTWRSRNDRNRNAWNKALKLETRECTDPSVVATKRQAYELWTKEFIKMALSRAINITMQLGHVTVQTLIESRAWRGMVPVLENGPDPFFSR